MEVISLTHNTNLSEEQLLKFLKMYHKQNPEMFLSPKEWLDLKRGE